MSNQKNCLASPTESHSSPLSGVHIIGYYASLSTSSTHEMSKYIYPYSSTVLSVPADASPCASVLTEECSSMQAAAAVQHGCMLGWVALSFVYMNKHAVVLAEEKCATWIQIY